MPRHEEQAILPYSADELFAVLAGVKDYPRLFPVQRCAYSTRRPPRDHC
jgi:ribosome-associated toxin RatA of RatAB toxin-antitoxin module